MKNYEIKTATAEYTGGGIYIYYGQLENGLFFRTCDDWEWISICNADTSIEDAEYHAFYNSHEVESLSGELFEEFWNEMLTWIIVRKPSGNYQAYELEERLLELESDPLLTYELENAQELKRTIQENAKKDKFYSMMLHQEKSIASCMGEFRDTCKFFFAYSDQYSRDYEKQWKEEFYNKAVELFESNGYRIIKSGNHTLITW